MAFNNLVFLYILLPLCLILYFVVPKKLRNIPLLLASIVFYAWGNPASLIVIVFSILFNYLTGLEIARNKESESNSKAKASLIAGIIVDVAVLALYKYLDFIIGNLNLIPGLELQESPLIAPLGISFFTFSVLSYIIDVYTGKAPAQNNLMDLSVYVLFFPKIIQGPIVQYADIESQLHERTVTRSQITSGLSMFIVGLAKKVIIADTLGSVFESLHALENMSAATAWLGMILFSLQLFVDWSGYSDMAIGLGRMFGFEIKKNFDYPYIARSVSDFWRRWHISLGQWFTNYIYFPMGGSRCSKGKHLRNLLVVWLLTGIWHGASWNFIAWGLWHGFFVILEHFFLRKPLEKMPSVITVIYTDLVAFFGWVMFFSDSLTGGLSYYAQMFGAGHLGVIDGTFLYYLGNSWIAIVLAVLCCWPGMSQLHARLAYRKNDIVPYVSAALTIVLLIIATAMLMNSTYSAFLYAQF